MSGAAGGPPPLDARAQGWLRYLYRKATTPDDWDRVGQPHPHWDDHSDPPMLCWHRFDLIDSTYAIALMADRTPAWREVYGRILDELIFRHTGWWAARDWLTQIGHDPDRASYPDLYRLLIPAHLWGSYDVPGWTANGIEPWGLQMDPIGADGNLFFKGFFLVMLGLHLRTTGDERWNDPFDIVRDGENTFTWFHSAIAEHLHDQWVTKPDGCHCENTKIWPYCLAGAGLGLQLHDLLRGTHHHEVFTSWWTDVCRDRYLHLDGDALPENVTLYYDPIVDVAHEVPVFAGMVPAIYLAPQEPEGARRLFEAGMTQLGLWEPSGPVSLPGPRASATALWLAREWGLSAIEDALSAQIDAQYQPTFDATSGEFTWGFELDEEYPRGQYNGTMAAAQVATRDSWWRLANELPGSRFTDPTVEGVDFPTLSLDQAWWDAERSELAIGTTPMNDLVVGQPTTLRVVNLDEPARWTVTSPASSSSVVSVVPFDRGIQIHTTVDRHHFVVSRSSPRKEVAHVVPQGGDEDPHDEDGPARRRGVRSRR